MNKVYFTKNINSDSLINIFKHLNVELKGKVGIKVSTGEEGSQGYLKQDLIKGLHDLVNGTYIECCTAYDGERTTYEDHIRVAREHGFNDCDILDKDGDILLEVDGKHLKYDLVGKNIENYDSFINLAHGKGHAMGGFGANLKNQSIGFASRSGKAYIHSAGKLTDASILWENIPEQKDFIESMAEACLAVKNYLDKNNKQIVYITVINYLSVDCDCDSHQSKPVMDDIGIIASLDPVSNDQAFYDLIMNSNDPGKSKLLERINTRFGEHILEYAESIGVGSREYELVNIDEEKN